MQTYYQRQIAQMVPADIDPRHVEAYMRLEHSTLSGLDERTFKREVKLSVACIREGGVPAAEANAQSFGL